MKLTDKPVRWSIFAAALALTLAFVPYLIPPVYATQPAASAAAPAVQTPASQPVRIGVYVLNVGSLDLSTGNYDIDFYLNFSCDNPCHPENFDILNGKILEKEDQTSDDANGTWRAYRVRASLITDLDMKNYPFDEHKLIIEIEDKINNINQLHYEADPTQSGVDVNAVVSGWYLKTEPSKWAAEVVNHKYPIYGNPYSRYRFFVTIYHPWQSSFLKGLFAPIVIVLVGLLSVLMNEAKISDRLALTTSSLVGSILYHLSVISSIPPVGYLTYMDKFMLINYLMIAAALTVTVVMMVYKDNDFHARAKKLNQWTRNLIPTAWVVLLAVMTWIQFG